MKTAIITGASRGIGAATAQLLFREYNYLALISRNKDRGLENLTFDWGELPAGKTPCEVELFSGDISDAAFAESVSEKVVARTGSIDLLINNAGISYVGLLTDMTPDEWKAVIDINLTSVFNLCHAVVPHMVREKTGRIINISSVWGLVGASCEVAYSASKAGINGFTMALAKELAPSGIAVNAIAFGAVDTEMNGHLSAEEKEALFTEIPAGRMATPEEAAESILHLSHMPLYFTGEIVKVDGGWI